MQINTNGWNRIRYTLLTPVYDLIGRVFTSSRRYSINKLRIQPTDKVLLVGAGTGLDLAFIPPQSHITATDLTPAMVARLKQQSKKLGLPVEALVMDGQQLAFADNCFDHVILHLIVAVIPDPVRCLQEAERVLKTNGKVAVFDKFLKPGQKVTLARQGLNYLTNALFSDINRDFEVILQSTRLKIVSDEPADWGGNFRVIILTKPGAEKQF